MDVFLSRVRRRQAVLVLVFLLAATTAPAGLVQEDENIRHRLGHFDAGSTIAIKVGEKFTVSLERKPDENAVWIWPMLPVKEVKLDKPEPETTTTGDKIIETYTFVGVGLGFGDVFAELVHPDDYANSLAHYAVKVQVVP